MVRERACENAREQSRKEEQKSKTALGDEESVRVVGELTKRVCSTAVAGGGRNSLMPQMVVTSSSNNAHHLALGSSLPSMGSSVIGVGVAGAGCDDG
jgi:hypothetical protein